MVGAARVDLDRLVVDLDGVVVAAALAAVKRAQGADRLLVVRALGQHLFVGGDGRFHLVGFFRRHGHQFFEVVVFRLEPGEAAAQVERLFRKFHRLVAAHQRHADVEAAGVADQHGLEELGGLGVAAPLAQEDRRQVVLDRGVIGLMHQRLAVDRLGFILDDPLAAVSVGELQDQFAGVLAHRQQRLDGADGEVVVVLVAGDAGELAEDRFILRHVDQGFFIGVAGLGILAVVLDVTMADGDEDFGRLGIGLQGAGEDLHRGGVQAALGGVTGPEQAQADGIVGADLQDVLGVEHGVLVAAGLQVTGGHDHVGRRGGRVLFQQQGGHLLGLLVVTAGLLAGLAIGAQKGAVALALLQHQVHGGQDVGGVDAELYVKIGQILRQAGIFAAVGHRLAEGFQRLARAARLLQRLAQDEEPGAGFPGDAGHFHINHRGGFIVARDGGIGGGQRLEVAVFLGEEDAGALEDGGGLGVELLLADVNIGKLGGVAAPAGELDAEVVEEVDGAFGIVLGQGAAGQPVLDGAAAVAVSQPSQPPQQGEGQHQGDGERDDIDADEITQVKLPGFAMGGVGRQHGADLLQRLVPVAGGGQILGVLEHFVHFRAQPVDLGRVEGEVVARLAAGAVGTAAQAEPGGGARTKADAEIDHGGQAIDAVDGEGGGDAVIAERNDHRRGVAAAPAQVQAHQGAVLAQIEQANAELVAEDGVDAAIGGMKNRRRRFDAPLVDVGLGPDRRPRGAVEQGEAAVARHQDIIDPVVRDIDEHRGRGGFVSQIAQLAQDRAAFDGRGAIAPDRLQPVPLDRQGVEIPPLAGDDEFQILVLVQVAQRDPPFERAGAGGLKAAAGGGDGTAAGGKNGRLSLVVDEGDVGLGGPPGRSCRPPAGIAEALPPGN